MSNGNNPRREPSRKPDNRGTAAASTRGRIGRARQAFQWSDIPAADVGELVHTITNAGAAVICGVTSDGGALSITILDGDERLRDWPSNADEFATFMEWLHNSFKSG